MHTLTLKGAGTLIRYQKYSHTFCMRTYLYEVEQRGIINTFVKKGTFSGGKVLMSLGTLNKSFIPNYGTQDINITVYSKASWVVGQKQTKSSKRNPTRSSP